MSQQPRNSTVSFIPGQDGDLQIVIVGNQIMVDVQAAQRDVEGRLRRTHAMVRLSHANALALRDALNEFAEPADHRRRFPSVWANPPSRCPFQPGRFSQARGLSRERDHHPF
jgi:hypothetical protein